MQIHCLNCLKEPKLILVSDSICMMDVNNFNVEPWWFAITCENLKARNYKSIFMRTHIRDPITRQL